MTLITTPSLLRAAGVLCLTLLGGCSSCRNDAARTKGDAPPRDAAPSARPKTTSGELALGNLNDSIELGLASRDPRDRLRIVRPLLDRAHYLGRIADLETAQAIADEPEADAGDATRGERHYARAMTHNAFHRFDAALKELDLVTGLPAQRVQATRASVYLARGRYADALAVMPSKGHDAMAMASAAVLAAKMQKPDWERQFDAAREQYRDVSPFPLAWMDLQRGMLLELAGEDARARIWFQEATDVLPPYAHAAVHLSTSEAPAAAIARLEAVRATSDDPEVLAALAAAHRRAGHAAEADALIEDAKRRYDAILAKHPEAFADHGARFWLNAGNDPKKALELARLNATNRPTEESLDLWMAAAAGAKDNVDLCRAVRAMAALEYISARGKALATASLAKCPD